MLIAMSQSVNDVPFYFVLHIRGILVLDVGLPCAGEELVESVKFRRQTTERIVSIVLFNLIVISQRLPDVCRRELRVDVRSAGIQFSVYYRHGRSPNFSRKKDHLPRDPTMD